MKQMTIHSRQSIRRSRDFSALRAFHGVKRRNLWSLPRKLINPLIFVNINLSTSLLSLLFLTACAGPKMALRPLPQAGQTTRLEQGQTVIESTNKHLVMVRPLQTEVRAKQRLQFLVVVGNRGQEPFDLALSNISVTANDQPLKLWTYEEQKRQIETAAAWMAVATGLSAASASINAAMPQPPSGTLYVPGAGGVNYSMTQVNPANTAVQQATIQANMNAQLQSISATSTLQLQGIDAVLRSTTIVPGAAAGGVVTADGFKKAGTYAVKLTVNAQDKPHTFQFESDLI